MTKAVKHPYLARMTKKDSCSIKHLYLVHHISISSKFQYHQYKVCQSSGWFVLT